MLLKSRPLILKISIGHHKNLGLSLWISRPFIIKPRPVNLDHENKSRVLAKMAFHNKISVWNFSFSCSRYLNRLLAEWHINAAWCKKNRWCNRPEYSFSFRLDRLSDGNNVKLHKVNFRPNIRKTFFWKKSGYQEFVWLLKQFEATVSRLTSNLGKHMTINIQ